MCKEYNGYTNYQTWNVSLWLDNDEGTYNFIREIADDIANDETIELHTLALSDRIKDFVEDTNPLADDANVYSDLLNHSLAHVMYHEIATNIMDE